MNKRQKSKLIPYGDYCYGRDGICPFRKKVKCKDADDGYAYSCTYLHIFDKDRETLLWDADKECEKHFEYPNRLYKKLLKRELIGK